jgi:hypothetical protein
VRVFLVAEGAAEGFHRWQGVEKESGRWLRLGKEGGRGMEGDEPDADWVKGRREARRLEVDCLGYTGKSKRVCI